MKKEYLMFAFVALGMLTACSSNDDAVVGPDTSNKDWNGEIKLQSEIATTRATYGQDTQILPNQLFYLWVDDSNFPTKLTGLAANETRTLYNCVQMTSDGLGGFYNYTDDVYYPVTGNHVNLYSLNANPDSSAANISQASHFAIGGTFPTSFVQKTDSLQNNAKRYAKNDLLFASHINKERNNEAAKLRYQHLLSKIVVVTDGSFNITDCRIKNVRYRGNVSIIKNYSANPTVMLSLPSEDLATCDIIMGKAVANANGTNDSIEAVIFPQTINAGSTFLQFTVAEGGTFTYQLPSTKTFSQGQEYIFRVIFTQTHPTIQAQVIDWNTNAAIDWE
ncbi:MAG: fimbrillin family protein [Prevotella sp.]|nr:fimbrillin family protein [Prevotella sp.]